MHRNHYKVYNLCSERTYDKSRFLDVACFPFDDHQAPEFKLMFSFCQDLFQFLYSDKEGQNTASVHCKAGKGRTGVMICCYLMYSGEYEYAVDALRYYAMMRTKNKKGVTIPSQIRYVYYFEKALQNRWKLNDFPVFSKKIAKIKLTSIPNFNYFGGCDPFFIISFSNEEQKKIILNSQDIKHFYTVTQTRQIEFQFPENLTVQGDVYVQFFQKSTFQKKEKMFQFWFNCAFFEPNGIMIFDKNMLDTACKDVSNQKFPSDLQVEIHAIHSNPLEKIELMDTTYIEQNQSMIKRRILMEQMNSPHNTIILDNKDGVNEIQSTKTK